MPSSCKSEEGLKAYQQINYLYPFKMWDQLYENFLKMTEYSTINQEIMLDCKRVQSYYVDEKDNPNIEDEKMLSGEKPREYIVFDLLEKRFDALGNQRTFFRSNIGMFPIPVPQYKMKTDPIAHYSERVTNGVSEIKTGYSILFTKENANKILKKYNLDITSDPRK
jgi:hypothetical protein